MQFKVFFLLLTMGVNVNTCATNTEIMPFNFVSFVQLPLQPQGLNKTLNIGRQRSWKKVFFSFETKKKTTKKQEQEQER